MLALCRFANKRANVIVARYRYDCPPCESGRVSVDIVRMHNRMPAGYDGHREAYGSAESDAPRIPAPT